MLFAEILSEVGDYDTYQRRLLWLVLLPLSITFGVNGYGTMFMVYTPDHWCFVPELANLSMADQHRLIRPLIWKQGNYEFDTCSMYDINYEEVVSTLELPSNNTSDIPTKKCLNGWSFDRTDFTETASTHVSITCLITKYMLN